jgi:PIN domain nuclease of toxin-antitoxin system
MASVVADTHAVLWALLQPQKLSAAALAALQQANNSGASVYIASISVVETHYLEEKGKLQPGTLARLKSAIGGENSGLVVVPLDLAVAEAIGQIRREAVPDMPDRIIAATALYLQLPLISRDRKIRAAEIATIW